MSNITQSLQPTASFTGPNAASRVTAKTQLMQNYTVPVELAKGYDRVYVGLGKDPLGKDSGVNLFAITDADPALIIYYRLSATGKAGWRSEEWALPDAGASDIALQQDADGFLTVYAISKQGMVFRRHVSDDHWHILADIGDGGSHYRITSAYLNGKTYLAATRHEHKGSSKAWWIDSEKGGSATATDSPHYIYSVAIGHSANDGPVCLYAAQKTHVESTGKVKVYPHGSTSSAFEYADSSKHHYEQIALVPDHPGELYALRSDGHLHWYPQQASSKQRLLSDTNIDQFSVINAPEDLGDAAADAAATRQLFCCSSDKVLYYQYLDSGNNNWSDSIGIGRNVGQANPAWSNNSLNLYAVSTADTGAAIMQLSRTPGAGDWHRSPVTVAVSPPTTTIDNASSMVVGSHQATAVSLPQLHMLKISTTKNIRHYVESSEFANVWLKEDYNLPNGKQPHSLSCCTNSSGQLMVYCLSTQREIFRRAIDDAAWTSLGVSNASTVDYIQAQQYSSEPTGTVVYTLGKIPSGRTGAGNHVAFAFLPGRGWDRCSGTDIDATALCAGTTLLNGRPADGYYIAGEKDGVSNIRWYPTGAGLDIESCMLGGDEKNRYQKIQASSLKIATVFALKDNGHLRYYSSTNGSQEPFGDDEFSDFALVDIAPYGKQRQTLYALRTDGDLRISVENSDGSWSKPRSVSSNNNLLSVVSASFGREQQLQRLFTTHGNSNLRFREVARKNGKWQSNNCLHATASAAPAQEYASYTTQVTTGDLNCNGVPNTNVYFRPNNMEVETTVNGIRYRLDPADEPMRLVTDSNGKATFTVAATGLATPQLLIWTDYVSEDDALLVRPDGEAQDTLAKVSKDDLRSAEKTNSADGSTSPLFSDPSDVTTDFTNAVNDSMQMVDDDPTDGSVKGGSDWYCSESNPTTTLVVNRGSAHQFAAMPCRANIDRHFRIDFAAAQTGSGNIRHRRLSKAQGQSELKQLRTLQLSSSVPDFNGKFGDIMRAAIVQQSPLQGYQVEAAASAKVQLKTVVFSRRGTTQFGVLDGIEDCFDAAVNFVVDGVEYIWKGIVYLVQEAFDLAEAIFAEVEVLFNDLFAWLGDFFLWGDILNTQALLKAQVQNAAAWLPDNLRQLGQSLTQQADRIRGYQLPSSDSIPSQLNQASCNEIVDENNQGGNPGDSPQGNWLLNQTNEVLEDINFSLSVTDAVANASQELITGLVDVFEDEVLTSILEHASNVFEAITQQQGAMTPAQMMHLMLSEVEQLIEDLIAALLDAADVVLDSVANLIEGLLAALDTPLEIPFLSDLYTNTINPGHPLSLLDLVTLIAAVPATLGFKLMMVAAGRVPAIPVIETESKRVSPLQICMKDIKRSRRPGSPIILQSSPGIDSTAERNAVAILQILTQFSNTVLGGFSGILAGVEDTRTTVNACMSWAELDVAELPEIPFIGFANVGLGTVTWLLSAPIGALETSLEDGLTQDMSPSDRADFISALTWMGSGLFPAIDIGKLVVKKMAKRTSTTNELTSLLNNRENLWQKVDKFLDEFGDGITSGLGVIYTIGVGTEVYFRFKAMEEPSNTEIARISLTLAQDVCACGGLIGTAFKEPAISLATKGAIDGAIASGVASESAPAVGLAAGEAVGIGWEVVTIGIPVAIDACGAIITFIELIED